MDPAGSAVAGADVAVTNLETNIGFKTKTTDAGQFAVPYLPQGVRGFRKRERVLPLQTERELRWVPRKL
jgi:hypothetical protein